MIWKQKGHNFEVQPYTVEGTSKELKPVIMHKIFEKNFIILVK